MTLIRAFRGTNETRTTATSWTVYEVGGFVYDRSRSQDGPYAMYYTNHLLI